MYGHQSCLCYFSQSNFFIERPYISMWRYTFEEKCKGWFSESGILQNERAGDWYFYKNSSGKQIWVLRKGTWNLQLLMQGEVLKSTSWVINWCWIGMMTWLMMCFLFSKYKYFSFSFLVLSFLVFRHVELLVDLVPSSFSSYWIMYYKRLGVRSI